MSPADTARYRQIADTIRGRIESGELPPGFTLPGEITLAEEHGVARGTIQRALEALRTEGYVETIVGRGTQVRDRRAARRLGPDRYTTGWGDVVATSAVSWVAATNDLALALDVATGDELLRQEIVHELNGRPWRLTISYIPKARIARTSIAGGPRQHAEPIDQLASAGVHVDQVDETLSSRMPVDDETRLLQILPSTRVTVVSRVMRAGGLPVETAEVVIPADQVRLSYRITP